MGEKDIMQAWMDKSLHTGLAVLLGCLWSWPAIGLAKHSRLHSLLGLYLGCIWALDCKKGSWAWTKAQLKQQK